jgi:hypothetical protein
MNLTDTAIGYFNSGDYETARLAYDQAKVSASEITDEHRRTATLRYMKESLRDA